MKLLFVVRQAFLLEGVGLVLGPGAAKPLELGAPLFLIRADGTHVTAIARPLPTKAGARGAYPVAVPLGLAEVPLGTRVFGT